MRDDIVKNKSFVFAVRIVKLYQYLCNDKKAFILSKQLLRSGTSVGAMICEAEHAESKNDFKLKMAIAQKKTPQLLEVFLWGEQDSNLRSSHSRFTVCPRWPLEYLPKAIFGCKYNNCLVICKLKLHKKICFLYVADFVIDF
jgi:hypothetical protein